MPRRREPAAKAGAPALRPAVAELRALAHPLRLRVLEAFAEQPRTTKQVAVLLGEPPTRLYHHVAALERAGLLRLTETRKNRGTVEKWYEAIARSLRTPKGSASRPALAMGVLEQSRQEVVAAMRRRSRERPLLARVVVVAPRAAIAGIRTQLVDMLRELQRGTARPADGVAVERWALTITFARVSGPNSRATVKTSSAAARAHALPRP